MGRAIVDANRNPVTELFDRFREEAAKERGKPKDTRGGMKLWGR